jgi:hypothetical protein
MRYLFSAGASAGVLPLIKTIDIAPTNAIAAAIAWIGFGLVVGTIVYGRTWRERVDGNHHHPTGVAAAEKGAKPSPGDEDQASGVGTNDRSAAGIEASRRTSMTLQD